MQLILPKTEPYGYPAYASPLFFLAGPIGGGDDWHSRMMRILMEWNDDCIIVNPTRYTADHPFCQYRVNGREGTYQRQTDWERHYLRQAADEWPRGCIIFWLPEESKTNPRTDGNPYAMDTRGELGEWRGHLMHNPGLRVVIGAEEGFPGLSIIKRNFELALGPDFKIHSTMEEVVEQAMKFAK